MASDTDTAGGRIDGPLLLVGCGKMGGALLAGWLARGLAAEDAFVVEPAPALRAQLQREHGVEAVAGPGELPVDLAPRALILAIKPQSMADVLPDYREIARRGPVVLSIAAGTTMARLAEAFGATTPIVRAMPNTPAAIGQGASALIANDRVTAEGRALAEALMAAVGMVRWIDDEALMHAITGMSGGGPAYVFLLIECLAKAGVANGLPAELAADLARATVVGSGALAAASREPPEVLRQNVTSPGGTTQAALEVLMAETDGLQPCFDRAIAAAAARSGELG